MFQSPRPIRWTLPPQPRKVDLVRLSYSSPASASNLVRTVLGLMRECLPRLPQPSNPAAPQGFQLGCGRVSPSLARQNSLSWVAIGVIDDPEIVSPRTHHFDTNPAVLIARTVIELEAGKSDAALPKVPTRKPETGYAIVVVSQ